MSTDPDAPPPDSLDLERLVELLDEPGSGIATGPLAHLGNLYVICHHQMAEGDTSHALRTLRTIARMERRLQLDLTLAGAPGPGSRRTLH